MDKSPGSWLKHAWNAFFSRAPTVIYRDIGAGSGYRPDRHRLSRGNEQSIVTAIINRMAIDAASIEIKHVKLDDDDRYLSDVNSGLNYCLNTEANIDQTGRAFRQDFFMSMLDEGVIAVVPVDTDTDPDETGSYTIESLRVGKIVEWYPQNVKVQVYNDRTGRKEELIYHKKNAAIMENPFYSVMNEKNSVVKRLIHKLNLLDAIDEQSGSGKLDLIIQLPYVVKSDTRRAQAEQRRSDIENQLSDSKYGIAYVDATERITQLNRPVENNLMKQIEYLTSMLYGQLGITQSIMDGTADEQTMLNYFTRTIEPIVATAVDEMIRTFLTKTARTQKHTIMYFRDPFKLVPVEKIAEIGDSLTRNEIATSNEMRQKIGWKPSKDPRADELRNKNLSEPKANSKVANEEITNPKEETQNGERTAA